MPRAGLTRRALLGGAAAGLLWPRRLRAQPAAPSQLKVLGNVAVAYDTSLQAVTPGTNQISLAITVAAGSNRALALAVAIQDTGSVAVTGVSGANATWSAVKTGIAGNGSMRGEVWQGIAPDTGSVTVTVTLSGVPTTNGHAMVASFNGVDQTTVIDGVITTLSGSQVITVAGGGDMAWSAHFDTNNNRNVTGCTTTEDITTFGAIGYSAAHCNSSPSSTFTWDGFGATSICMGMNIRSTTRAIVVVAGSTAIGASAVNGGNPTVTLPTLWPGDIVLAWGGFASTGVAPGISSPNDFTTLSDTTGSAFRTWFGYKKMGSTPDTSLAGIGSGSANDGCSYNAVVFRNVDGTTPIDNTTVISTANGTNPDVSAITTLTDQATVVVLVTMDSTDISGITAPTNYTVVVGAGANDTNDSVSHGAYRHALSVGSENPGAFSGWATNGGEWIGATIALRLVGQTPAGGGRTTKNTRSWPLGTEIGMNWRVPV